MYYLFLLRYFSNISLDLHFYSLIYLATLLYGESWVHASTDHCSYLLLYKLSRAKKQLAGVVNYGVVKVVAATVCFDEVISKFV